MVVQARPTLRDIRGLDPSHHPSSEAPRRAMLTCSRRHRADALPRGPSEAVGRQRGRICEATNNKAAQRSITVGSCAEWPTTHGREQALTSVKGRSGLRLKEAISRQGSERRHGGYESYMRTFSTHGSWRAVCAVLARTPNSPRAMFAVCSCTR